MAEITVKQFIVMCVILFSLVAVPGTIYRYAPPNECARLVEDRQQLIKAMTNDKTIESGVREIFLQGVMETDSLMIKCGCK